MVATAGYAGSVKLGANTVALVQDWSFDGEVDMLEVTSLGSDNKAFIPGLFGATATIECYFDLSDTLGQKALHDAFFGRTLLSLSLVANASGTLGTYAGSAYINKISPSDSNDDKVTISFDVQFTGAVTFS